MKLLNNLSIQYDKTNKKNKSKIVKMASLFRQKNVAQAERDRERNNHTIIWTCGLFFHLQNWLNKK